jgi:hypothetical protein
VPLDRLQPLTLEERTALLETVRLLQPQHTDLGNTAGEEPVVTPGRRIGRPGDMFNLNGPSWSQLLEPAGWTLVREDRWGTSHWRRPGKRRQGTSATVSRIYTGYGEELFYVFSTKAAPFEPGTAYSKFAVWAQLYHRGDYKAAARALALPEWPLTPVPPAPASPGEPPVPPAPVSRQVETVRLSAVRPQRTQWVWHPWLPAGTLTILDGDPGLGKSTLTLDLAARLTRGATLPFEEPGTGEREAAADVLLLSAEDDAGRTIQPRLVAAWTASICWARCATPWASACPSFPATWRRPWSAWRGCAWWWSIR